MWKCKHCGIEADSKCPSQRSVFLRDQKLAMLENMISIKGEDINPEFSSRRITITIEHYLGEKEDNKMLGEIASDLTPEYIQAISCRHQWQLASGDDCQLGCGAHQHYLRETTNE
jgi:hypothetical protein